MGPDLLEGIRAIGRREVPRGLSDCKSTVHVRRSAFVRIVTASARLVGLSPFPNTRDLTAHALHIVKLLPEICWDGVW
jgi:hypothetical protein